MSLNKSNVKFPKRFSLKTKLSLLFTTLFFLIISIVAMVSYFTLMHLFHKAEYDLISSEMETIKYMIHQNNIPALQHEINDVPGVPKNEAFQYYIRVHQLDKKFSLETQGMHAIIPLRSLTKISLNKKIVRFEKLKRNYFLMESSAIYQNQVWIIQILLDTTYQNKLEKEYGKILIFMLVIGALISGILGYIIMQRSIRSLIEMTKAAQTITSNSLNQRLDTHYWPKEFSELGFAFNNMLDRIEESFLRLRSFSAELAHEIRTPINNLMGQTEVALLHPNENLDYRQTLEANLEDLKLIAAMVENLLFIAQTENPRLLLTKQKINLYQAIAKIKDYYAEVALEKAIDIDIEGHAILSFNPEMFARMISNLLSNSLKYTNLHGKILFHISDKQNMVEIQIRDNGIGMSHEHHHRLFERFYRIDQARSRDSGGIGLGLAIVKSIVDLHRGKIQIESEEGVGTCLCLQFPK